MTPFRLLHQVVGLCLYHGASVYYRAKQPRPDLVVLLGQCVWFRNLFAVSKEISLHDLNALSKPRYASHFTCGIAMVPHEHRPGWDLHVLNRRRLRDGL
jgi:hypothetical protein